MNLQYLDSAFLLGVLIVLALVSFSLVLRGIFRLRRRIRRRPDSESNPEREARLTWLTVLAVLLAVVAEFLIATLILTTR